MGVVTKNSLKRGLTEKPKLAPHGNNKGHHINLEQARLLHTVGNTRTRPTGLVSRTQYAIFSSIGLPWLITFGGEFLGEIFLPWSTLLSHLDSVNSGAFVTSLLLSLSYLPLTFPAALSNGYLQDSKPIYKELPYHFVVDSVLLLAFPVSPSDVNRILSVTFTRSA
jgi:hypothetical protein